MWIYIIYEDLIFDIACKVYHASPFPFLHLLGDVFLSMVFQSGLKGTHNYIKREVSIVLMICDVILINI